MSDNDEKKFVDELLDAGLARYSAAVPRSGLENRILAGLRAQPRPSRWLDWRLAGALATVAVALVIVILFFRQPPPPDMPPQTAVAPPSPAAPATPVPSPKMVQPPLVAEVRPVPHPSAPAASGSDRRPEGRLGPGPRLETFPAPAPLSEQERLLLLFTRQTPQEAVLMAQARSQPTQPLGVAPLQPIEALVKKTEENNN